VLAAKGASNQRHRIESRVLAAAHPLRPLGQPGRALLSHTSPYPGFGMSSHLGAGCLGPGPRRVRWVLLRCVGPRAE
jgi:hypothetical protein